MLRTESGGLEQLGDEDEAEEDDGEDGLVLMSVSPEED